jgi:hypothetical protein
MNEVALQLMCMSSFWFSPDYNPSSMLSTHLLLPPELLNSDDQGAHYHKPDGLVLHQILYRSFMLCIITCEISFDTTLHKIYNYIFICIQLIV